MNQPRRWGRAAPWLAGTGVLLILVANAAEHSGLWRVPKGSDDGPFFTAVIALAAIGWGGAGALIGARRPENPISLVLAGEALLLGLASFGETYSGSGLAFASVAVAIFGDLFLIPLLLAVPLLLLLFPTGSPPSQRWRRVGWLIAVSAATGALGLIVSPSDGTGSTALGSVLLTASAVTGLGGSALAVASVVVRFRRSRGEERAQMRWLAFMTLLGGVLFLGLFIAAAFAGEDQESLALSIIFGLILVASAVGLPVSIGISILRYRLYELDVVIRKTVIFGILVVLIMAVAIAMLFALSSPLTEIAPDETQAVGITGLVVGLLAWPLWRLSRRIADRMVFGGRASPYEVLTQFSARVGETYSADDVLPRMAHVLGGATGAEVAHVWLRVGNELRPASSWPADDANVAPLALVGGGMPDLDVSHATEVRHQGDLLGALSVTMPANDPINPSKERLVRDLAAQAGPVLRNVLLVEDLRESRRRIVTAQDERAKKLERDLHDGAQQQLVALSVQLKLARSLVERDPAKAGEMLDGLQEMTSGALEDLRDLARGIYPPLLADKGLPTALEAQARKAPVPVRVEANGVGRYPQEVESAVYFCTLEALNNVTKYAAANAAQVTLSQDNGRLTFSVTDDGRGFDPSVAGHGTGLQGMADRLDALGGELRVQSTPGGGTTITGTVPASIEGSP